MATISDKQKSFIIKLCDERPSGTALVKDQIGNAELNTITAAVASSIIGVLLKEPKPAAAKNGTYISEVGIYKGSDGHMYKVQESKWNPGKFYAKRLMVSSHGVAKFEYDPSGMKQIAPEDKVALGEAVAFGQQFGVCCNCGRTLTAGKSIEAGLGTTCIKKFG